MALRARARGAMRFPKWPFDASAERRTIFMNEEPQIAVVLTASLPGCLSLPKAMKSAVAECGVNAALRAAECGVRS